MGNKYKEYGGGPATGLANDFVSFLSQGLNTGTFGAGTPAGADAYGSTMGIAGVLNDILSGGAGNVGGALAKQIQMTTQNNVEGLRARYGAGGGTAYGTPAAYAEGVLRAQQAPALTTAIGQLQMNAVQNILAAISGISSKGIAQRQGVMQPSALASGLSIAAPIAGQILGFMAGGPAGAAVGGQVGSSAAGAVNPTRYGGTPFVDAPIPGATPSAPVANYGWTPTLFDYGLAA